MATWVYVNRGTGAHAVAHYHSETIALSRDPDLELVCVMNWPWEYRPEWGE